MKPCCTTSRTTKRQQKEAGKVLSYDLSSPVFRTISIQHIDGIDNQKAEVTNHQLVNWLADSLSGTGQMAPIFVQDKGSGRYRLCKGSHRIQAAKSKGIDELYALVFAADSSDSDIRKAVLEHNVIRNHSWVRLGKDLLELKSIYEAERPSTRHGAKSKNDEDIPSFRSYLIDEFGLKPSVKNLLTTVKNLDEEVLEKLEQNNLPQSVGDQLRLNKSTKGNPESQVKVIDEMIRQQKREGRGRKPKLNVAKTVDSMNRAKRQKECDACTYSSSDAQVLEGHVTEKATLNLKEIFPIPDGSIDAVICDPLYAEDAIWTYKSAAKLTKKHLKKDGFALFYCGRNNRKQAERLLDEHLEVIDLITLEHHKSHGRVAGTMLSNEIKYMVLCRQQGSDAQPYATVPGVIHGTGQESGDHEYQQAVSDLTESGLLEAITNPGEVVLDYFSGSGTTAVASILKKRKVILIEEDANECAVCRKRIEEAYYQLACLEEQKEIDRHCNMPFQYSEHNDLPFAA